VVDDGARPGRFDVAQPVEVLAVGEFRDEAVRYAREAAGERVERDVEDAQEAGLHQRVLSGANYIPHERCRRLTSTETDAVREASVFA
jgi:hypothetical protein